MHSTLRQFGVALAGTVALAACEQMPTRVADSPPTFSAVERTVDEALYDMAGSYFVFGCTNDGQLLPPGEGELVAMEGRIYEKFATLQDARGAYHLTYGTMPVGLRGVGVASGEEFRVSEREHGAGNQLLAGGTGTYRTDLKLVGTRTQRTFWMIFSGVYRFGPDGEVDVQRDAARTICGPARTG